MSLCLPPIAAAPCPCPDDLRSPTLAAGVPAACETLRFDNEVTLENVGAFRDRVFTAIGRRPVHLCLDLTACVYVDTSGLAALVTVVRVARLVNVAVMILPAPHLRRVLTVSGLIRVLPIAPLLPASPDENGAQQNTQIGGGR